MATPENFTQPTALGTVGIALTRYLIEAPASFNIPYEGTNELVKAAFPQGFVPSYGSGLAFKAGTEKGEMEFFCLTDRGPNGDGPMLPSLSGGAMMDSKIFPAPGFSPSIGILRVSGERATLVSSMPIRTTADAAASGLPIPHGSIGNSEEIPVFDSLRFDAAGKAVFHAGGIDSEAIAWDPLRKVLWVTDEYGPFLLRVDPATGVVLQRYGPGSGLPQILAKRRANRGMEGMTIDPSTGRIHAFLQSPLSDGPGKQVERHARFLRWVEFDPAAGATTKMMAYPLDPADFAKGRTGHAKLGDVAALGGGRFVVIEQGEGASGAMFNRLMLVEAGAATDISAHGADLERSSIGGAADWAAVVPMRKTMLVDLNRLGWVADKAEGLALVDECTLAITNDNDFGMVTRVFDAGGAELAGADVTAYEADAAGAIVKGGAGDLIRVAPGDERERPLGLWLLRFDQPLGAYRMP